MKGKTTNGRGLNHTDGRAHVFLVGTQTNWKVLWDWWSRFGVANQIATILPHLPSAVPWQIGSLGDIKWPFALTFQKQWSLTKPMTFPSILPMSRANTFINKWCRLRVRCLEHRLWWKCANFFHIFCWPQTDLLRHPNQFTLATQWIGIYTYTNEQWRNLSTNRLLPTLLLSLSSVCTLNYMLH